MFSLSSHVQVVPQGSQLAFPPRHASRNGGVKLKLNVTKPKFVCSLRMYSSRCHAARLRPLRVSHGAGVRSCKVTSFQGNEENKSKDDSSIANFSKNHLQIYFSHHGGRTLADFPKLFDGAVSYAVSAANKTASRSQAVQRLFRKWVKQHRERPNEARQLVVDGPAQMELVQAQPGTRIEERSNVLMLAFRYFLGLDATIKVPLLIFVPFFIAVNVLYGVEVAKELIPLWIIGPLVAALYTRIFQKVIALYVFSVRLPTFCRNVSEGLKEAVVQRVTEIKSLDHKEIARRKCEELKSIMNEIYIQFTDLIWPTYVTIIRILKKGKVA